MIEKLLDLLLLLRAKTREGTVRWEETADDSHYRIAFGGGIIRVMYDRDDPRNPYGLVLLTREGKEIDRTWFSRDDPDADLVADLFNAARSSALNVDGLVNGMMAALERGETEDVPPDVPVAPDDDDIPF